MIDASSKRHSSCDFFLQHLSEAAARKCELDGVPIGERRREYCSEGGVRGIHGRGPRPGVEVPADSSSEQFPPYIVYTN